MPTDIDPDSDNAPASAQTALRAAEYVRMSTEHQQYSTHNQADKIREYAKRRGIEIVRTYADEGKSGLSLEGRASLQQLIGDVESGRADFSLVLVYDVSRWGRFQDADESAYYEYICKRQGITVVMVAVCFLAARMTGWWTTGTVIYQWLSHHCLRYITKPSFNVEQKPK